jgi:hypothetical protein
LQRGAAIPLTATFRLEEEEDQMKNLYAGVALVLLSSAALAQWDRQYVDFSEGEYAGIPLRYPSVMKEEDVKELIRQVAELTDDEISHIQYLPLPGNIMEIEVHVMLCERGTRSSGVCDSGEVYTFTKVGKGWVNRVYPGASTGRWAY